jgi:hypothetical protein
MRSSEFLPVESKQLSGTNESHVAYINSRHMPCELYNCSLFYQSSLFQANEKAMWRDIRDSRECSVPYLPEHNRNALVCNHTCEAACRQLTTLSSCFHQPRRGHCVADRSGSPLWQVDSATCRTSNYCPISLSKSQGDVSQCITLASCIVGSL